MTKAKLVTYNTSSHSQEIIVMFDLKSGSLNVAMHLQASLAHLIWDQFFSIFYFSCVPLGQLDGLNY